MHGSWEPLPQGEYDDGATAFVKLPEGGIDALLGSPLAAPGHGYVPPRIAAAATDPAATGSWAMPETGPDGSPGRPGTPAGPGQAPQPVHWPDPNALPDPESASGTPAHGTPFHGTPAHGTPVHGTPAHGTPLPQPGAGQPARDPFAYDPGTTGQWTFPEAADTAAGAESGAAQMTGQWSIPVADGDLPDESGEFTTSALASQWTTTAPATLPGGAPAPWATEAGAGQPWSSEPHASEPQSAEPREAHLRHPQHADVAEETAAAPGDADAEVTASAGTAPEPVHPAPAPSAASEDPGHAHPQATAADDSHPQGHTSEDASPEGVGHSGAAPEDEAPAAAEGAVPASGTDPREAPAQEAAAPADAPAGPPLHDDRPLVSYVLRVNGGDRPVTDAWIGESLLYVLRERLGLAGAKDGCSQGECGACNVQVDGRLVASCLVPAATAAGSEVRTVEGLAADGQPSDVQRALARCGAVQCGFCVPGMAMTVHDLLEGNPSPTDMDTRQALCGNLCRCSGYRGVLKAVQEVAAERAASAAGGGTHAGPAPDGDVPEEARIPHQAGPGQGGVHPGAHDPSHGDFGSYEPYQPYDQDGGQA
ncbi:2Fe-2S iron-sulfur cluster-binding protein [Streptomyces sp. NPDC002004]